MLSRTVVLALMVTSACFGQSGTKAFDVASVKISQRLLGKDAESQVVFGPAGLRGSNLTLKDLIGEAYQVQPHQIIGGPNWLDVTEYDIDSRVDGSATREQLRGMLQTLLTERFRLEMHREARELRVYDLVADKKGPKVKPVEDTGKPARGAFRGSFRGSMRQLANLISIQLTIPVLNDPNVPGRASGPPAPVLDRTGLPGIYEVNVNLQPELGVDMFTLWQRFLQDQLGLKLERRTEALEMLVVESADKTPSAN